MTPGGRVLRVLRPEYGGPRSRRVLEAIAEHHGAKNGAAVVDKLQEQGKIQKIGNRGPGVRYGLPAGRERRRPGYRRAA